MEQEQATLREQEAEIARAQREARARAPAAHRGGQRGRRHRAAHLTELDARLSALSNLQARLENNTQRESWLKSQGLQRAPAPVAGNPGRAGVGEPRSKRCCASG
jgi:hypothetical protein